MERRIGSLMPTLISAAPTFLVPDVASAAQWYETNLKFSASFFPKTAPYVYASLQRNGVEIMLVRLEGYRKPQISRPGGVWDAYIRVKDLLPFYEAVRERAPIKMELRQQPYGDWEFEVEDPNGYVLVFGELPAVETR
jgi:uncharacterized glyoxalase superfamily protein PhnB